MCYNEHILESDIKPYFVSRSFYNQEIKVQKETAYWRIRNMKELCSEDEFVEILNQRRLKWAAGSASQMRNLHQAVLLGISQWQHGNNLRIMKAEINYSRQ